MSRAAPRLFDEASVPRPATPPSAPAPAAVADTQVDPVCLVCGAPAPFGFGVFLRRGQQGRRSCFAHRADVEAMT